MIGTRVQRVEDPALLTVGGNYVDDVERPDALVATFVRSVMAHANIAGVDTSEAASAGGVVGVFTAKDLGFEPRPPSMPMFNAAMTRPSLATDTVRYVGEPIAVVVSHTREQGVDAAELVDVAYEPLVPLLDPLESLTGEVLLFPEAGTNVAFAIPSGDESDPFADCDVTVSLQFRNQRLAPCPLEPRAALAVWDENADYKLTQWASTQGAHGTRDNLAAALGLDPTDVRVITPDVGGGFGAKNGSYPEDITVAALSRALGRPVRWGRDSI